MRRVGTFLVAAIVVATLWSSGEDPAPAVAADQPRVAFVGDSIGRDAEPEIRAEVSRTATISYYHAIGAGFIRYHLPRLLPHVQAEDGPDIVVAELGTGDAFWGNSPRRFESDMRDFLDRITPHVACVVWIDQKATANRAYPEINERAGRFNRIVRRVVRDYADTTYLHYAAWTELAGSPGPYFLADHLHLTTAGERELGRLVGSAVRGCQPDLTSGPFWDVQDSFWAADAVNWAAGQGLVGGYDNDTYRAVVGQFKPPVTRGQAAAMVWRLMGSPTSPAVAPHGWSDGRPWLRGALRWGAATGVLTGYPDGTFRPDAPLQRGALVNMLWKAVGRPQAFPISEWSDAVPPRLQRALDWAAAHDVVLGIRGEFRHLRPVNRAQVANWLQAAHAYLQLPVPAEPNPPAPSTTGPPTTGPPPVTAPEGGAAPTTATPPTVPSPTTVP